MTISAVGRTGVTQLLVITIAIVLTTVLMMERRRPLLDTCRHCGGYGNTSGNANDVGTVCPACRGSGWNTGQLDENNQDERLRVRILRLGISKLVSKHTNNFAAELSAC